MDKKAAFRSVQVAKVGQRVEYVELVKCNNAHQLRIVIRSDSSYHFQSEAKVEVWKKDGGWEMVHRLIPTALNNYPSYVAQLHSAADFKADRDELFNAAAMILGAA